MDRSSDVTEVPPGIEQQASVICVRRHLGAWGAEDELALAARLTRDAVFARAFARMERAWDAIGRHAEATMILKLRQRAAFRAQRVLSAGEEPGSRSGPR